ncbi:MAG TPA: hypothetical protein VN690_06180 [Terriglobales bacterium]|nr:hypothetical protein [Terriglobales bacterium]
MTRAKSSLLLIAGSVVLTGAMLKEAPAQINTNHGCYTMGTLSCTYQGTTGACTYGLPNNCGCAYINGSGYGFNYQDWCSYILNPPIEN